MSELRAHGRHTHVNQDPEHSEASLPHGSSSPPSRATLTAQEQARDAPDGFPLQTAAGARPSSTMNRHGAKGPPSKHPRQAELNSNTPLRAAPPPTVPARTGAPPHHDNATFHPVPTKGAGGAAGRGERR
eukprot:CAMPEP_0180365962 /NCGR_PEP_ID=MMETSP0989-20121125/15767_1 /TAXON_ID=697907 /ORGANISM="non described non described, Strain CCMP2293" /LENGTH=129 /DNA_ID=CAMNT_0022359357 /DNA_START=225 /DNA_END=611 /DNA_ORIENTATION=-